MSLTKCPECGREVSDKAAACPGCGAPVAATPDAGRPSTGSSGRWKVLLGVLGGILVFLFVVGLLSQSASTNSTPLMKSSSSYYGGLVGVTNLEDFEVHDCTVTLYKGSNEYDMKLKSIAAHASVNALFATSFLNKYGEGLSGRPEMVQLKCHDPRGREIAAGREFD